MAIERPKPDPEPEVTSAPFTPEFHLVDEKTSSGLNWHAAYSCGLAAFDFAVICAVTLVFIVPVTGSRARLFAVASALLFVSIVAALKGYDARRAGEKIHAFRTLRRGFLMWMSILLFVLYSVNFVLPPQLVLPTLLVMIVALLGARVALQTLLARARASGRFLREAVVIGDPSLARELTADLGSPRGGHGLHVLGVCADEVSQSGQLPVLGAVPDAPAIIVQTGAEVAIVTAGSMDAFELRRLRWAIEPFGVELFVAPDLRGVTRDRVALHSLQDGAVLSVAVGSTRLQRFLKSALDRTLGGMLLLLAAVPLITLCAWIRLSSPGPALFTQVRIGARGEPFIMFKLRTMYIDAEERRAELAAKSDGNVVMFKMQHDPRITPIGRTLRRLSLDELPQLLNVVRGDMSLVGPRPPLREEVSKYDRDVFQRFRVKPGMTGLWQVSGRSDLDWDETVRLDLNYSDNWSVKMDLITLFKTFRAVVGGKGAY